MNKSTSPCCSCGYDLAGLEVSEGKATCPECGTHQDIAGHCGRCRHSLVGVPELDGHFTCPECGFKNLSEGLVQRGRDADFVRQRSWLMWSPVVVLPGSLALLWAASNNGTSLAAWISNLGIVAVLWCFAAPVLYVVFASAARVLRGQRAWPAVEVGAMWLVTSLLASLVLYVIAVACVVGAVVR